MNAPATYVVTDIEADGLNLGVNSMISFASVAVGEDSSDHGTFTVNLHPFEGSRSDLATLVMGVHGWSFDSCRPANYPEEWLGGHAHSHRAIDDARGYAHLLRTLLGHTR